MTAPWAELQAQAPSAGTEPCTSIQRPSFNCPHTQLIPKNPRFSFLWALVSAVVCSSPALCATSPKQLWQGRVSEA